MVVVHCLILNLESRNILRTLSPCFPTMRIDISHSMSNPIVEILHCVAVGIEVAIFIPLL